MTVTLEDLPSLDQRLRSRLQCGLIADVKPPNLHTRMAILYAKADAQGLSIGTDVLEFLASRLPDNVRELEGALTRVAAYARLTHRPLTLELAAAALEDVTSDLPPPLPTPEAVLAAVCRHFNLSRQLVTGRDRDRQLTYARQIAMYLLREEARRPLARLAVSSAAETTLLSSTDAQRSPRSSPSSQKPDSTSSACAVLSATRAPPNLWISC